MIFSHFHAPPRNKSWRRHCLLPESSVIMSTSVRSSIARWSRVRRRRWSFDADSTNVSQTAYQLKVKKANPDIAVHGNPISELRDVTCHLGSHSVICHPTQVNAPRLNPSHAGWYSIYLPGRLSWPSWLDSAPARSRTSDLSITSPTPNRCTTKTTTPEEDRRPTE